MDETTKSISKRYSAFNEGSKIRFVQSIFQIAKTEPFDECWCGSGKLFAYCHKEREKERVVTESFIHSEISKIMDNHQYCCATFDSHNCNGIIKGAHTIQRGRVLASMAIFLERKTNPQESERPR